MTFERPGPAALVEQPQARDVAEQAERSRDTALVRQIGCEGLIVDQRLLCLDSDERPRADAEECGAGPSEGHRSHRRSGVVRRDCDDRRPVQPRCLADIGGAGPSCVPGATISGNRRAGMSRRSSRSVAQPPCARVVALRRRRVRELGRAAAAEPVVDEVRDEQQRLGGLERGIVLIGHRGELEHRVDRHQLDPRALIELARRYS